MFHNPHTNRRKDVVSVEHTNMKIKIKKKNMKNYINCLSVYNRLNYHCVYNTDSHINRFFDDLSLIELCLMLKLVYFGINKRSWLFENWLKKKNNIIYPHKTICYSVDCSLIYIFHFYFFFAEQHLQLFKHRAVANYPFFFSLFMFLKNDFMIFKRAIYKHEYKWCRWDVGKVWCFFSSPLFVYVLSPLNRMRV